MRQCWSRLELVLVAGLDRAATERLVKELVAGGTPAESAPTIEDAVRSADIVCATTHADRPIVRRGWLGPGTDVDSVGYNSAGDGEVDGEVIRDSLIVVESRDAVLAPAPSGAVEIRRAIQAGIVSPPTSSTRRSARSWPASPRDVETTAAITLYKSVGVAVQDAAAAMLVLQAAAATGAGISIDL